MLAGLQHPDNPNHEEGMPSFLEASARYNEYGQLVDNNADEDVDAALDALRDDLQAIFDAAMLNISDAEFAPGGEAFVHSAGLNPKAL